MDEAVTRAKIELYRRHAVSPFCGGTVVETALLRNKVRETLAKLADMGFQSIELSDNLVDMDLSRKRELIGLAAGAGFEVLFEYGKKYDDAPIDVAAAAGEIRALCEAGASRVILERSQLDATLGADCTLPTADRIKALARKSASRRSSSKRRRGSTRTG
jgi:phosphosulfolactate synthase